MNPRIKGHLLLHRNHVSIQPRPHDLRDCGPARREGHGLHNIAGLDSARGSKGQAQASNQNILDVGVYLTNIGRSSKARLARRFRLDPRLLLST